MVRTLHCTWRNGRPLKTIAEDGYNIMYIFKGVLQLPCGWEYACHGGCREVSLAAMAIIPGDIMVTQTEGWSWLHFEGIDDKIDYWVVWRGCKNEIDNNSGVLSEQLEKRNCPFLRKKDKFGRNY